MSGWPSLATRGTEKRPGQGPRRPTNYSNLSAIALLASKTRSLIAIPRAPTEGRPDTLMETWRSGVNRFAQHRRDTRGQAPERLPFSIHQPPVALDFLVPGHPGPVFRHIALRQARSARCPV